MRNVTCKIPCFSDTYLDNAVMVAWASMHRFLAEDHDNYSVDLRAKWNIEELSN
jgi:tRNA A37 threonylcarbamoyltransferase TsaD